MIHLPIGYDDFRELITEQLTFVDKTLLIKEFIDNKSTKVSLITRPRRFGKSLNLSMLQHFFAAEVAGLPTQGLFDGLKIAALGDKYMRHQGQYPVVAFSLKDIKEPNFDLAYAKLCDTLSQLFEDHSAILTNANIGKTNKIAYEQILEKKASRETVENALMNLTECLFQHYGKKSILLLDEYDTPIQAGYVYGYYQDIILLMRGLFGAALKSNRSLHRAVLTGILRVSKESLFSGVNNLIVYSVLHYKYSQYFGFTEEEVMQLLQQAMCQVKAEAIKAWYNGYQIGGTVIYNPWSIVNCLQEGGSLQPYWVGTSDNAVLKTSLAQAGSEFKKNLELLFEGKSIDCLIDENFVFGDLLGNQSVIWSLLLASGYLKALSAAPEDNLMKCRVAFPNKEVMLLYRGIFKQWFSDNMSDEGYQFFLRSLLEGKVNDFVKQLKLFLLENMSQFDVKGWHPEKFYHGFVLGLMASLQQTHLVKSNRESSYGRYDVSIIPKNNQQLGIVLEFKNAEEEDLSLIAEQALQQITDKQYAAEVFQSGVAVVLKLGLAFCGKKVAAAYEFSN